MIIIMNGKLIQTLNTQTVTRASAGLARNRIFGKPSAEARTGSGLWGVAPRRFHDVPETTLGRTTGSGLCGVATRKFHDVAETTIGTTQGSSSSTLNTPRAGIFVRSSSATARPTAQLPNTPVTVKITVKLALAQN